MEKDNFYYFMQDVLDALPGKFERKFVYLAKHHAIVKDATQNIFVAELEKDKPKYRILRGALILFDAFLNQNTPGSIYEVIDLVEHLKRCMKSRFKTIRSSSKHIILKLFAALYFEYVLMPGRRPEDRNEFLDKFRKYISVEEMLDIFNSGVLYRYYFQLVGIDLKHGQEAQQLMKIIEDFYGVKLHMKNL